MHASATNRRLGDDHELRDTERFVAERSSDVAGNPAHLVETRQPVRGRDTGRFAPPLWAGDAAVLRYYRTSK